MIKEEMTIHKALSELKLLDKRIANETNRATFSIANKHSNTVVLGMQIADFAAQAKGALSSIRAMINRRNAIKRAVTRSNATTTVTVCGVEYTVAEAIDMKNTGMDHFERLHQVIEMQYTDAQAKADRENGDRLEQRADTYVQSLCQNSDKKNLSDEAKKFRDDFITSQKIEVLDPIGSIGVAANLRDFIDGFMSEVDSALSVSNALTKIIVEYETT